MNAICNCSLYIIFIIKISVWISEVNGAFKKGSLKKLLLPESKLSYLGNRWSSRKLVSVSNFRTFTSLSKSFPCKKMIDQTCNTGSNVSSFFGIIYTVSNESNYSVKDSMFCINLRKFFCYDSYKKFVRYLIAKIS